MQVKYGLANVKRSSNGQMEPAGWLATMGADMEKIDAAANLWCVNTVRLQVSQDNLLGVTGNEMPNAQYLNAINEEVRFAEQLHLVVVINDRTETVENYKPAPVSYQQGPTPGTEKFWRQMASTYGDDNQVIFDLFSEPRVDSNARLDPNSSLPAQEWNDWYSGVHSGPGPHYLGMQQLVDDVRHIAPAKLFWVEGPDYAASFAGMERANALIHDSNFVYAFHHPLPAQNQNTAAVNPSGENTTAWYRDFGYLINTGVGAVVDGEWTNSNRSIRQAPRAGQTPQDCSRVPQLPEQTSQLI